MEDILVGKFVKKGELGGLETKPVFLLSIFSDFCLKFGKKLEKNGFNIAIAYCLLPITYCLLPIAYCLLPIAYCLLPIAYCLLPIAY